MTEIHNGRCEITISVNGFDGDNNNPNETSVFDKEMAEEISKPPRKRVSFHDNVTDIDDDAAAAVESEDEPTFENGDQLEEELILHENGDNEDEKDLLKEELDGILNVSEKINFFKSAFVDKEKNGLRSLGHQSSIPEARLAFVTGMVESSLAGNNSREVCCAHVDSDDIGTVHQEEDIIGTGEKTDRDTCSADELDLLRSEMAATQVTFMKIFASPPKTKNGIDSEYFYLSFNFCMNLFSI